jgi:hypothetical protein
MVELPSSYSIITNLTPGAYTLAFGWTIPNYKSTYLETHPFGKLITSSSNPLITMNKKDKIPR